MISQT